MEVSSLLSTKLLTKHILRRKEGQTSKQLSYDYIRFINLDSPLILQIVITF